MSDPIFLFLAFFVAFPLVLLYFQRARQERREIINQLRETNRLLSALLEVLRKK
ncbi:MAG: hypothetical protein WHS87_05205 [Anaerolineales bacterium]